MSKVGRSLAIARVFAKYRLDELLEDAAAPDKPGAIFRLALLPCKLFPKPKQSAGVRLRQALETLGPVFVKFGQLLSTRRDLLPAELADELAALQDQVPGFPSDAAQRLITEALGQSIDQLFKTFDVAPLASASIAQVHTATLHNDDKVVVKIVRPNIESVISEDLAVLKSLANIADNSSAEIKRLHLPAVVEDYRSTILKELDLLQEAANTTTLRYNFADSPLLYVPRVYKDLCAQNVLVLERIYGTPIAHIDEMRNQGVNMKLLAERGVETFFTQVFVDNFFHADMHPGNIFVDISDPDNPSYIAVDCAIIGSLTSEDQTYLAKNLLAFFNRDYAAVATLHVASGWIPADTNLSEFEAVIRSVCDPIFEKSISEISFGEFLVELFQTARQFDMEVQPQLVLLQKTLLYIEGLGRQLYPELDLWQTAKPFMEQWMEDRLGPTALIQRLADDFPTVVEHLPDLPNLMTNTPVQIRQLQQQIGQQQAQINQLTQHQRWRFTGLILMALGTVLVLGGLRMDWIGL